MSTLTSEKNMIILPEINGLDNLFADMTNILLTIIHKTPLPFHFNTSQSDCSAKQYQLYNKKEWLLSLLGSLFMEESCPGS